MNPLQRTGRIDRFGIRGVIGPSIKALWLLETSELDVTVACDKANIRFRSRN